MIFNRVLILSASAGAGHVRAAQALERAFQETGAAREVRHVDTLEHTGPLFRKVYADAYLDLVNKAPQLLGWLYDRLDKPWGNRRLNAAINRINSRRMGPLLKDFKPDLVVCTHFLPAEILARLKRRGELDCPLAVAVTDLDVHGMWLVRDVDRYFVALEETRVHMEKLGVDGARVTVSGIPIDPVFACPKDQAAMRAKHGLVPDRTTILVSAGGFGVGPVGHMIESLRDLKEPAQVVVICGKNAELKQTLDKSVCAQKGNVTFHAVGYTTEMDEYMAAADLLVGKPGGLTTSEALARGLVMVIVNPIPGQEERNSDHLLEEGAAIRCNNLPTLAYKIDGLLGDRQRLEQMRAQARRLARPDAARAIVRELCGGSHT